MNHPTSSQCYEVARLLRTVAPNHNLNMLEGSVCGTFLCHGGAYYVAKGMPIGKSASFSHGALYLAQDLGFRTENDLTFWASRNEHLWLNYFGNSMFVFKRSFANHENTDGAETISDIARHWELVGDNIKNLIETK